MSTADEDEDSTTLVFTPPSTNDLGRLPTVLTAREAATVLRIGVKEVRQLVDAGDIPAARFGPRRVIRIARSALERILRGHERRRT